MVEDSPETRAVFDRLLARLGLDDESVLGACDPMQIGAEAGIATAFYRPRKKFRAVDIALAAQHRLPSNATLLERGIAIGVALALVTEPA